jgi:diacylglycerol kinase (ATP)
MKIFFLLNPSQREKEWDYREMGAQAARRAGWTPRFGEVDSANPRSTEHLLRQALEEDCTRVGIVGGDGTLHRALNGLSRLKALSRLEIAAIPAGSCNDFARSLGLRRKRLNEAFQVACSGRVQPVDVGVMDSELFLNNAGIGRRLLPAKRTQKSLQTLKQFRPLELKVDWERGSIQGVFFMGLVCNAPYFSGGLYFSKHISPSDGWLDVYLVPAIRKWKLLTLLLLGRLGRPLNFRPMVTLKVQQLRIQADSDLWPQADGEPPGKAQKQVEFSIAPEKAMIVFPG